MQLPFQPRTVCSDCGLPFGYLGPMEKDFHLGATYAVARLAGFDADEAQIIATSSQYVDDTVSEGTIRFKTGEQYSRISTSHEKMDPKILLSAAERKVWVPFHFLPAIADRAFPESLVCLPNSAVARAMLKRCIEQRNSKFGLHRLGITAHVFVDTWAHQGFAGIRNSINHASQIQLDEDSVSTNRLAHLKHALHAQGIPSVFSRLMYAGASQIFPMGHGAALHYPDWPFLKWSYRNFRGERVERNNPKDFDEAANELYKFFRCHLLGDPEHQSPDMPSQDREIISDMFINIKEEDGDKRYGFWEAALADGKFSFGPAAIEYQAKGVGSWKQAALGTASKVDYFFERFHFTPEFLSSNWKLFHDAAQSHQEEVLHSILPQFGTTAI